ncbi:MAG: hypothetical protein M1820_004195 [Bogoriella megaspora]|nr:MAG: hypothetical protein M1820_004195 [Bogoriella megaspora]
MAAPPYISLSNDAFPEYRDGNCIIRIGGGSQLQLHLDHLKRSSERFKMLFAEGTAPPGDPDKSTSLHTTIHQNANEKDGSPPRKKAKKRDRKHYLILRNAEDEALDTNPGQLFRSTKEEFKNDDASYFAVNYNALGIGEPKSVRLWRNVFRSFYNEEMQLDQADLTTLLIDATGMISIANYLGCMRPVAYRIEHALLSQSNSLYRSIMNNPVQWMTMAWTLDSKEIYKECLIHLSGIYDRLTAEQKRIIPPQILPKIEEKAKVLDGFKTHIDMRLATWISPDLKPRQGAMGNKAASDHGRTAYADNIYMWIAQHLFDHFLKFAFQANDNRSPRDGGFTFYHSIFQGGDAYLTRGDQNRFHQANCPMTPKAQKVLFNAVSDLKVQARELVKPLFANALKLDRDKEDLRYFTCVPVTDEEAAWIIQAKGDKENRQLDSSDEDDGAESE